MAQSCDSLMRTLALKGFSAEDDTYVAMDLVNPGLDYVGLARAQGVPGELVDKTAGVAAAIKLNWDVVRLNRPITG